MPTITDSAVVIRTWDFSETSQTVCLFGREHGMIRGLAKGAKRERGKFCGGFDLLSRGQIIAIVKRGSDLAQLIEWDLQHIWWSIRQRLEAYHAGMYIADLVYHLVTDHDPHPELFDSIMTALDSIERRDEIGTALLGMQFDLLRTTGYQPELRVDANTGAALEEGGETLAFSPASGGVVADTGESGRWRVRRETIECLRSLAARPYRGAAVSGSSDGAETGEGSERPGAAHGEWAGPAGVPGPVVERANRLLAAYIRHVLGREPATMPLVFPDLHA